jgi:hypothetical protein
MYAMRRWSVRNARFLESLYNLFEPMLGSVYSVFKFVGYQRLERPVAAVERLVKGFMFDCQMCGECALRATGMSCPMNCPKQLRNGPCGGVRPDGGCEVEPEMRCVWVEAWEGSRRMRHGDAINRVQLAVDFDLQGKSSWLRVARQIHDQRVAMKETRA